MKLEMRIVLIVTKRLLQLGRKFLQDGANEQILRWVAARRQQKRIVLNEMEIIVNHFRFENRMNGRRLARHSPTDGVPNSVFFVRHPLPRPVANANDDQTGVRQLRQNQNPLEKFFVLVRKFRFVGQNDQHGEVSFRPKSTGNQLVDQRRKGRGPAHRHVFRLFEVSEDENSTREQIAG